MRYAVRRVSPLSALLYGLLLGLLGSLLPGLLLGWLARLVVVRLLGWLASLNFILPIPLTDGVAIDLVALLQLSDTQAQLTALAARDTSLMLVVTLATAAAGRLLAGLTALFSAVIYNLLARAFGGVEVTLDALDASPAPRPARPTAAPKAIAPATSPAPPTVIPPVPPPAANPARPARPVPHAWLVPVGGGERRPLGDGVTRIGSAADNDIVLPGLSPQHAEIRRESGRYLIYDLGSRRTWVNDAQVAAVHMLKDGFRLQLGQGEFLVQIVAN
jgi:hypothetical protein